MKNVVNRVEISGRFAQAKKKAVPKKKSQTISMEVMVFATLFNNKLLLSHECFNGYFFGLQSKSYR